MEKMQMTCDCEEWNYWIELEGPAWAFLFDRGYGIKFCPFCGKKLDKGE
jgi:hypothetical protein